MQEHIKTYCFDLDDTLCHTKDKDYEQAAPIQKIIDKVNFLYEAGNTIKIYTARGMGKFKGNYNSVFEEYYFLTANQLEKWGVNYHELKLGKISYDVIVDDKCLLINDFLKSVNPIKGFIAGCFDVIHPGYIHMFKEMKQNCDLLVVGLHSDPTIERKDKMPPILSVEDRKNILESIKYIDEVIVYNTEAELFKLIDRTNINIRFLGDDYIGKKYTGNEFDIPVKYISRDHGWSSTKFKELIVSKTYMR